MRTYSIKEVFYTLQGEGAHTGRPAIFVRFSGCNLWNGIEKDRKDAVCNFCDTDFVGTNGHLGGRYSKEQLSAIVQSLWPTVASKQTPYIVCTGGEPLLQLDEPLIAAFHAAGFLVAVETNGTVAPPVGLDWICVSPKNNQPLLITKGHELKLVYPQLGVNPAQYLALDFDHFFLQPMDGREGSLEKTIAYVKSQPSWRLSLQTHKMIGIE